MKEWHTVGTGDMQLTFHWCDNQYRVVVPLTMDESNFNIRVGKCRKCGKEYNDTHTAG